MKEDNSIVTIEGRLIAYDAIVRIEEREQQTWLILSDKTIHQSVLSIDFLEWELPKEEYWRVHPCHLVNKSHIAKMFTTASHVLSLNNGETIPVMESLLQPESSKKKVKDIISHFLGRKK